MRDMRKGNSWGRDKIHPFERYGEIIDYDGLRPGKKIKGFRGPATEEEAERIAARQAEHYKRHVELTEKKRKEKEDRLAGLLAMGRVVMMLSWAMNAGITEITESELEARLGDERLAGLVKSEKEEKLSENASG